MSIRRSLTVLIIGLLALATSNAGALAAGSGPTGPTGPLTVSGGALTFSITYQGELTNGAGLVNATCNFQISLFDSSVGGSQIGSTLTGPITVVAGRFTAFLNFGPNPFDGSVRWLDIAVQCPPDPGFTPLPRQPLTPAPLAMALPGLRTEPNGTSSNVVGGYSGNTVTTGHVGATIGGGGDAAQANHVTWDYGTVGGGLANSANYGATVGGGFGNTASNTAATVAGGQGNTAGLEATVGGGENNAASGAGAFVGGGGFDGVFHVGNQAVGAASTIGGGISNTVTGLYATVAGGGSNLAPGWGGAVGGGASNTASGTSATVPGGQDNTASGGGSFAAGFQAHAIHDGAFVWNDDSGAVLNSKQPNQFLIRASGGITMITNSDASASGAVLAAGSNSWSMLSDRNSKTNFDAVDGVQVLNALAGIPIQTWNYKTQAAAIRHIGPMAQDFYSAFQVGENDTTISTVDGQGVALAAIQGLYKLVQQKDAQIAALQAQQTDLSARVSALEAGKTQPAAPQTPAAQPAPLAPGASTLQLLLVLVVGMALGGGLCLGAFALGRGRRG